MGDDAQDLLLEVERIQDGPDFAFARLGVDVELFAARAQRSIAAKVDIPKIHHTRHTLIPIPSDVVNMQG